MSGATDYVERARALAPIIASFADRIEAERRLPAPLADALHEAGLFRMLLPRSLGGAELDPPAFVQVMEEIAKVDASTAWVLGQTAGCSMIAAYLPREAAARIFGPPRAVLAWGAGPQGRAVAVDGGYRLTGSWSFASGIHEATWVGAHAPIIDAERFRADLARIIAEKMNLVGLLAVEMFVQRDGQLLVNELAPRPHNSGHWTIEGCATSQFEQHVRAVCGLSLGTTDLIRPAAMANLLGDVWRNGEPNWAAALGVNGVHLHLYGKHHPRPRRKMGHLTALAENAEAAIEAVSTARQALQKPSS